MFICSVRCAARNRVARLDALLARGGVAPDRVRVPRREQYVHGPHMHALTPGLRGVDDPELSIVWRHDRASPARSVSTRRAARHRWIGRDIDRRIVRVRVNRYEAKISSWPRSSCVGKVGEAAGHRSLRRTAFGAVFNPEASASRVLLIDGPRANDHLRALALTPTRPSLAAGAYGPAVSSRRPDALLAAGSGDATRRAAALPPTAQTSEVMPLPWRPCRSNRAADRA